MDEHDGSERNVLGYRSKQDARSQPHPIEPILLCAPGIACWLLLSLDRLRVNYRVPLPNQVFWMMLLAAVVTALVSIYRYGPRPNWWSGYVIFNLVMNIIGLLFMSCMFVVAG